MALFCNRIKKLMNKQNGLIYIDALIGMIILSIGLTALAMSYRQTTVTEISSENYYQATLIAEQVLEEFRKNDGLNYKDVDFSYETKRTVNGITYDIEAKTINITKISGLVNENLLTPYKVTVSWPRGISNNPHSIELVSYYYFSP